MKLNQVASTITTNQPIEIDSSQLDTATINETREINDDWNNQLAIYKQIPEFKIAADIRAAWVVGEEIMSNDTTKNTLDNLTGWGKDNFRTILKNLITVKRIAGDAFAEIVRGENGLLINLKVLNPATITHIYNKEGLLIRYEETRGDKTVKRFKTNEIFHLTNKRIANEIHGIADSAALKKILEANNESFDDVRLLMHRYVKPMLTQAIDSSDKTKIDAYIAKFDKVFNEGRSLFYPKGTVEEPKVLAVPSNSTLNPLPWREHLKDYFYQVLGMPQIIVGGGGEFSESSAKIAYLGFEVSIKDEQRDIMEQVWDQLALRIELKFTKSLMNDLITDEKKDAENAVKATQPADLNPGAGR